MLFKPHNDCNVYFIKRCWMNWTLARFKWKWMQNKICKLFFTCEICFFLSFSPFAVRCHTFIFRPVEINRMCFHRVLSAEAVLSSHYNYLNLRQTDEYNLLFANPFCYLFLQKSECFSLVDFNLLQSAWYSHAKISTICCILLWLSIAHFSMAFDMINSKSQWKISSCVRNSSTTFLLFPVLFILRMCDTASWCCRLYQMHALTHTSNQMFSCSQVAESGKKVYEKDL